MKFLALLCLLAGCASAQSLKEFAIAQTAADGLDAFATYRNSANPAGHYREADPFARPFVTHGTPALAGYFAFDAASKIFIEYELRKHHHEKLARVFGYVGVADNTWGFMTSLRGYKK